VNHRSAAAFDHVRNRRPAGKEAAGQIDRQYLVPIGQTVVEHRADRVSRGRAVDKDVHAAKSGMHGIDR
jgi:hypothetical protein